MNLALSTCDLCPRSCGVDRAAGERGACGADGRLVVARAALHFWEEPPISGSRGSGTVFFAHCPLRCVYCQNAVIAAGEAGAEVSVERLGEMCLELQEQGALNVNFVTPTHYAPEARAAVAWARERGLALPVVWNTSGYETVAAVRANAGTVDAYLADFKYADAELARRYSHAPDYPEVALAALEAMVEEAGGPTFDEVDGEQRLTGGVVVRHLMLPGAFRLVHDFLNLLDPACYRAEINKFSLCLSCNNPCQSRLSNPRRSPENHGGNHILIDQPAQYLSFTDQVLLPYKLIQPGRPEPARQGIIGDPVVIK